MSDSEQPSTPPDIIDEITTVISDSKKDSEQMFDQFDRLVCSMERIEHLIDTRLASLIDTRQAQLTAAVEDLGRHVPRIATALEATANQLARVADTSEALIEMMREMSGVTTTSNRRYLRTADLGRSIGASSPSPRSPKLSKNPGES